MEKEGVLLFAFLQESKNFFTLRAHFDIQRKTKYWGGNMSLPANFEGMPGEEPHRYFRNLCIEFKKCIKDSPSIDDLQDKMEDFLNVSKEMNWHNKTSGVYHKEAGDKAVAKVWNEFKRYLFALGSHRGAANPQDLLDSLSEIERIIRALEVS
jgi:hypothetical protein